MTARIKTVLVAASMGLICLSAKADFNASMNPNMAQLRAEVETQLRANPDVAAMVGRAAGAGIFMPTLMRVMAGMPAVDVPAAVRAAVRLRPAEAVDIVGHAALYGPARAPAVVAAGAQEAPALATAMVRVVVGLLFGQNQFPQQKQVFQAALRALPNQLDGLMVAAMHGAIGRPETEWVAVAALEVGAPANQVVTTAIRTDPGRVAFLIPAVLRAGASPDVVRTAALAAGVQNAALAAAFATAGVAYPAAPQAGQAAAPAAPPPGQQAAAPASPASAQPSAAAAASPAGAPASPPAPASPAAAGGQITGLIIVSGPTIRVGQPVTVRVDGNGSGCGMEAHWGSSRAQMAAVRPDWWGKPFNPVVLRTPGVVTLRVVGLASGNMPACRGSAAANVTVVAN